jgi:hypothetical protein
VWRPLLPVIHVPHPLGEGHSAFSFWGFILNLFCFSFRFYVSTQALQTWCSPLRSVVLMKRRRIDEEGEGVDKSGGLAPDADSDRDVGTAWLLDDPNLLELVLDHCLPIQPSVLPLLFNSFYFILYILNDYSYF